MDGADFLAWQRVRGTPQLQATAAQGDADGDRGVDAADLDRWENSFGTNLSVPAETAALKVAGADAILASTWWVVADRSINRASMGEASEARPASLDHAIHAANDVVLASADLRPPEVSDGVAPLRTPFLIQSRADARVRDEAFQQIADGELRDDLFDENLRS